MDPVRLLARGQGMSRWRNAPLLRLAICEKIGRMPDEAGANSVVRHSLTQRVDSSRAGHVPRASILRGGHAALEEHAVGESPTPFSHARTLSR
jgi:hypothetical protein